MTNGQNLCVKSIVENLEVFINVSPNKSIIILNSLYFQGSNYGSWNKKRKQSDWSSKKTVKFYKALSVFGTDFSLMQGIFKKKTRQELKIKFKKEEKINKNLVDKCLAQGQTFDPSIFDSDEDTESDEEEKKKEKKKEKQKEKKKTPKKGKSCLLLLNFFSTWHK